MNNELSDMENEIRIFSSGWGVQSTAVLVMQAMGILEFPFDAFIFANVGDDSENPGTLEYLEKYIKPYAKKHGIELIETNKTTYGEPETLLGYMCRTKRSVPIPARMSNGAPGNRSCTNDFKIQVIDRWIKKQGFKRAVIGLGISLNEFTRMRDEQWHDTYGKKKIGYMKKRYHPLIHHRMTRLDCIAIIQLAGLPVPPKSACWFCPFTRINEWVTMRRNDITTFMYAILVEAIINKKRVAMGKDYVYLHPHCVPLIDAVGQQPLLPGFKPKEDDDEMCGGWCGL